MKIFKDYSAAKNKIFSVMDNEGKINNPEWKPEIENDILIKSYKDMLFARTADLMAVSYQRQGRMFTYPPNLGQEAISSSVAMVMKEDDWIVPAFREVGVYLAKGVPLRDIFLNFHGKRAWYCF